MDNKKSDKGDMFNFGENWVAYLKLLNSERIKEAEISLKQMLKVDSLEGKRFIDIGSGSGMFSLAAKNLGAKVISFDFDYNSVKCTEHLREKFYPNDASNWQIFRASVLDKVFMDSLPLADFVYSWGVLHHTGNMLEAMKNASGKVKPGGFLSIALYRKTIFDKFWVRFKKMYSQSSKTTQKFFQQLWALKTRISFLVKGKSFNKMLLDYQENRGMDFYKDIHDWLGGYPYETILPENCRLFFTSRGFILSHQNIHIEGVSKAISSGCDEYLFKNNKL